MAIGEDLMAQPPATELTANHAADELLIGGADPADVAARYPAYSAPWAALAIDAFGAGRTIEAYAYARTGYHRGLDALRRAGWKGWGSVLWSHEPNRGVLQCIYVLGQSASAIGETDEYERCMALLDDSDPSARAALAAA